jgi:hypothetical protein
MKRLLILFAFACAAFAQPTYTDVTVYPDSMTYTSFRVSWTLNSASTSVISYVLYGTDKTNLNFRTPNHQNSTASGTQREMWITDLVAGTRYYFRPVSANSAGTSNTTWGCTGAGTVTTGTLTGATCDANGEPPYITTPAKPTDEALMPVQPTPFTPTYPTFGALVENTNQFTVNSSGSNCQTQITAAATARNSGNIDVKVIVPTTATCTDITLPKTTNSNTVVVERPNADTVMPPIDKPIIAPAAYAPWPKFTTSPGTFAVAVKTFTTCVNANCNPVPTCGGLECTKGWYFRGVEIAPTDDPAFEPDHPTRWVPTAVTNTGAILKITLPSAHGRNQYDHWLLTDIGGCNVNVNGSVVSVADNFSGDTRLWFSSANNAALSGLSSCTWDGNGYLLNYSAQKMANVTCAPATDCVVDVGSGNYHGLKTGMYVTPYNVTGLSGLTGASATSGSYIVTKINDQTFSLNGSASQTTGTYTANSGSYAIDRRDTKDLFHAFPDSADITLNQVYIHNVFPSRVLYPARLNGNRMALINSYIHNEEWYPINVTTGISGGTGTQQSVNNLTPSVIEFSAGNGHLYQNNYFRCHGICAFAPPGNETEYDVTQSFPTNIIFDRNKFMILQSFVGNRRGGSGANPKVLRHHRHAIECKVCSVILIKGNYFEGGYSGEQTNPAFIGMTPRLADNVLSVNTNLYTRDITIRSNEFTRGTSVLAVTGHEVDAGMRKAKYNTRSVLVENNLIHDMDWNGQQATPYGPNAANSNYVYTSSGNLGGIQFNIWHSTQDVFIRHNTVANFNGTGPAFLSFAGNRVANIVVEDNLLTYHRGAGAYPHVALADSTATLQLQPSVSTPVSPTVTVGTFWEQYFSPEPYSRWKNNYSILGTMNAGGTGGTPACDTDTSSPCNMSSSQFTTDLGSSSRFVPLSYGTAASYVLRLAEAKILTSYHYKLRYNSDFASGGSKRATDGLQLGADIDALQVAQGKVKGAYFVNGVTKRVSYTAPDAGVCSTKASNSIITGSWIPDGGGDRVRNTTVTLGGASTVFLSCGAETYSCSASGGPCTLLARE